MARSHTGDPKSVLVAFKVTQATADAIDKARGRLGRSAWLHELVDTALSGNHSPCGHDSTWHRQSEWLHQRPVMARVIWDGERYTERKPAPEVHYPPGYVSPDGTSSAELEAIRQAADRIADAKQEPRS